MGDRRGHAHDVNAATVVAAEQVAAASQERLHSLERELGVKQREVAAASRQVRLLCRYPTGSAVVPVVGVHDACTATAASAGGSTR